MFHVVVATTVEKYKKKFPAHARAKLLFCQDVFAVLVAIAVVVG